MHLLVDDVGECWQAGSTELNRRLGDERPNFDIVDYAVRNLGFIELRSRPGVTHVACRPELVNSIGLVGLRYVLTDLQPCRLVLRLLRADWQHAIVAGIDQAVEQIAALAGDAHRGFVRAPLDLAAADDGRWQKFGKLMAAWRGCDGRIAQLPTTILDDADARDRSLTVALAGDGTLSIVERGAGFWLYGPGWSRSAAGRPFEDQPDRRYAEWIRNDYVEAIASGAPRFDYLEASVATAPNVKRRLVYERLILPWRDARGTLLASSFSMLCAPSEAAARSRAG